MLVNAPAVGDAEDWAGYEERLIDRLGVRDRVARARGRTPADLERETGALGGAIYGAAPHGRLGTLRRPAEPCAACAACGWSGGTTHPGGGLPLVALSGKLVGGRDRAGMKRVAARPEAARLVVALFAACGLRRCGGDDRPRLVTETVGRGAQSATIIRPDSNGRSLSSLFLHGWGATRPRVYRPWLDHLAREGNAVIYPRYQDSFVDPPAQALGNVLTGVRLALRDIARSRARWSWRATPRAARSRPTTRRSRRGAAAAARRGVQRLPRPQPARDPLRDPGDRPAADLRRGSSRWPAPATPSSGTASRGGSRARQPDASSASTTPPRRPPRPAARDRRRSARVLGAAGPADQCRARRLAGPPRSRSPRHRRGGSARTAPRRTSARARVRRSTSRWSGRP